MRTAQRQQQWERGGGREGGWKREGETTAARSCPYLHFWNDTWKFLKAEQTKTANRLTAAATEQRRQRRRRRRRNAKRKSCTNRNRRHMDMDIVRVYAICPTLWHCTLFVANDNCCRIFSTSTCCMPLPAAGNMCCLPGAVGCLFGQCVLQSQVNAKIDFAITIAIANRQRHL